MIISNIVWIKYIWLLHMEYTQSTFSDIRNFFIVKICYFIRISCLVISYVMWFNLICLSEKITCDYFEQSLRCIFYLSDKITCVYFEHGLNGILRLSEIITCDYFEHSLNWFYLHMKSTKSTFSDVKKLFIMKICHFVQISCLILSYMIWFISICSSDKITCDNFTHCLN